MAQTQRVSKEVVMDAQARDARARISAQPPSSIRDPQPLPTCLAIPADHRTPNASQQEEEEMPLPYVPLEELLKHGVAAGGHTRRARARRPTT